MEEQGILNVRTGVYSMSLNRIPDSWENDFIDEDLTFRVKFKNDGHAFITYGTAPQHSKANLLQALKSDKPISNFNLSYKNLQRQNWFHLIDAGILKDLIGKIETREEIYDERLSKKDLFANLGRIF